MSESEFEQAARLTEKLNAAYVAQASGKSAPETHPRADGQHCVECGIEIPERVKMGKVRCVECQKDLERFARARLINGL